jgi:MFS family permease
MSVYDLISRSYKAHIRDSETLRLLNVIILSAAVGMFLFTAVGGAAFTGYASALGAGEFAFGLISALPVLASLLQLPVSFFVQKSGKYKRFFMAGGVVQRLSWLAAAFIPYLFPVEGSRLWALIVLVTLAAMGGSFVSITHMSLMGSAVPIDIRGRYITARQRVCTAFSLVVGLGIAFVLDHVPGYLGYTVVFAVGGLAGLADILMYIPHSFNKIPKSTGGNPFVKGLKDCFTHRKPRNWLLFWVSWSFTVNLSAPFFAKYAIDVLSLSYVSIILLGQIVANVLTLLVVSRWGVFLDRYGGSALMMISGVCSTVFISVWLFAVPGSVWPLFLFNFFGGLFWCANEACMVNMQFSHTPEQNRPVALAVYAMLVSAATAGAFICGGALLEALAPVMEQAGRVFFGTPYDHYKLVFSGTMLLRFAVLAVFLPKVWNEKGLTIRKAYGKALEHARSRWTVEISRLRIFHKKR